MPHTHLAATAASGAGRPVHAAGDAAPRQTGGATAAARRRDWRLVLLAHTHTHAAVRALRYGARPWNRSRRPGTNAATRTPRQLTCARPAGGTSARGSAGARRAGNCRAWRARRDRCWGPPGLRARQGEPGPTAGDGTHSRPIATPSRASGAKSTKNDPVSARRSLARGPAGAGCSEGHNLSPAERCPKAALTPRALPISQRCAARARHTHISSTARRRRRCRPGCCACVA